MTPKTADELLMEARALLPRRGSDLPRASHILIVRARHPGQRGPTMRPYRTAAMCASVSCQLPAESRSARPRLRSRPATRF